MRTFLTGDPSPGPSNNNNNALITAKKTRKPRAPRNPNTTPAKKTVGTSKNAAVMGRGGGKKRKQPLPPAKVERKKFHCRKPGCEGKFQRRWELTWHLERAHGEVFPGHIKKTLKILISNSQFVLVHLRILLVSSI